jgi:hypothetical protein
VKIYDTLSDATLFSSSRIQASRSTGYQEEKKLWNYIFILSNFVHVTGQVYRFEDYLAGTTPTERPHISERLGAHCGALAQRAVELLLKVLDETSEPEQKQNVLVLIALVNFVADTGQLDEAEDFVINRLDHAPVAIAHFDSNEEAEAWLKGTAEPPSPALILIGDEYHQFWYMREDDTRGMYREYAIEPSLESLAASGIPPQTPSFATRAEAEGWLRSHPANPYAFVKIAGEHYFAVHHRRLKRHSLHPVATALSAWEERKRAVELHTAMEATAEADESSE